MADSLTREDLRIAFEYSWRHDDWVNPLRDALEGITAENALWRPSAPDAHGIWDIVLHLAVWNEHIVERVDTGRAVRPSEGSFGLPCPKRRMSKHGRRQKEGCGTRSRDCATWWRTHQ